MSLGLVPKLQSQRPGSFIPCSGQLTLDLVNLGGGDSHGFGSCTKPRKLRSDFSAGASVTSANLSRQHACELLPCWSKTLKQCLDDFEKNAKRWHSKWPDKQTGYNQMLSWRTINEGKSDETWIRKTIWRTLWSWRWWRSAGWFGNFNAFWASSAQWGRPSHEGKLVRLGVYHMMFCVAYLFAPQQSSVRVAKPIVPTWLSTGKIYSRFQVHYDRCNMQFRSKRDACIGLQYTY